MQSKAQARRERGRIRYFEEKTNESKRDRNEVHDVIVRFGALPRAVCDHFRGLCISIKGKRRTFRHFFSKKIFL